MPLYKDRKLVKRYFKKGEFNPRSRDQLLAFLESRGFEGGAKSEKTGKAQVNKKLLEQLAKKDKVFQRILDHKSISKVKSTYVEGTEKRLGQDSRLHPTSKHKPSTMRLSMANPNLQNIVADKTDNNIAAGFRDCIVAAPGCLLLESDFSAIEAVLAGYFMHDIQFIRLAQLGIHAYHASHVVGEPVSLQQSDEDLGAALKAIKAKYKVQYDKSKVVVYGTLFGQGAYGLQKTWPENFETVADAEKNQQLLYKLVPSLFQWHDELRVQAFKNSYLGLNQHPWRYRHWFWDVYGWNPKKQRRELGQDSKRVVAFYPQSTAAGLIKEAALRVLEDPQSPHYIGDCFFGKTPVRALIHDSILVEIEERFKDRVVNALHAVMTRPIPELPCPAEWNLGPHLRIGVAIKAGPDWGSMEKVELKGLDCLPDLGVAGDKFYEPEEQEENFEL